MAMEYGDRATDYLTSTQGVVQAGRRLRSSLAEDRGHRDFAIRRLERAADQHGQHDASLHAFMFSALKNTPDAQRAIRERTTEDSLVTVMTELQVANVLLAAANATGEITPSGEQGDSRLLDDAIARLDSTSRTLERALVSPLESGTHAGRFGFAPDLSVLAPAATTDAAAPAVQAEIEAYRQRATDTLSTLVSEAQTVIVGVFQALSKLDGSKIASALGNLGDAVGEIPTYGRLFTQGIEKIASALRGLVELLGTDALSAIKERLSAAWKKLSSGEAVTQALELLFQVENTKDKIASIVVTPTLTRGRLDESTKALADLEVRFKETMAIWSAVRAAVVFGAAIVGAAAIIPVVAPIAGPAELVAVALYVTIIAGVTLLGLDYADSGDILKRVDGVGKIVERVRTSS